MACDCSPKTPEVGGVEPFDPYFGDDDSCRGDDPYCEGDTCCGDCCEDNTISTILPVDIAKLAKEILGQKARDMKFSDEQILKAVQQATDEYNARKKAEIMVKIRTEVLGE